MEVHLFSFHSMRFDYNENELECKDILCYNHLYEKEGTVKKDIVKKDEERRITERAVKAL